MIRTKNFQLGCIHGKSPTQSSKEARVRNYLYGVGILVLNLTRTEKVKLRIIGYEVPIYRRGKNRDECIDLLAFDQFFTPWIIELKKSASKEDLVKVLEQLNRYTKAFEEGIRPAIQDEVRQRFLWPNFSFSGVVNEMILADRAFFKQQTKQAPVRDGIFLCSFARVRDEESLIKEPRSEVQLAVLNRRKF